MLLYIVRHAWAEDRDPVQWPDDNLRPLTHKGTRRFAKVARRLCRRGVEPELIVTSPLTRCRQTADLLRHALPKTVALEVVDPLQPGGDLDELLRWTATQSAQSMAWVGHQPDLSEIVSALVGGGTVDFPKGGAAAIRFDGALERGRGELLWLVTARMLGAKH